MFRFAADRKIFTLSFSSFWFNHVLSHSVHKSLNSCNVLTSAYIFVLFLCPQTRWLWNAKWRLLPSFPFARPDLDKRKMKMEKGEMWKAISRYFASSKWVVLRSGGFTLKAETDVSFVSTWPSRNHETTDSRLTDVHVFVLREGRARFDVPR